MLSLSLSLSPPDAFSCVLAVRPSDFRSNETVFRGGPAIVVGTWLPGFGDRGWMAAVRYCL